MGEVGQEASEAVMGVFCRLARPSGENQGRRQHRLARIEVGGPEKLCGSRRDLLALGGAREAEIWLA